VCAIGFSCVDRIANILLSLIAEELAAFHELARQPPIFLGRFWVTRGVVVDEQERGRALPERWPEDFARSDERRVLRTHRNLGVQEIPVFPVDEDHPEMFFVVVGGLDQLLGK
jgi:hypothetical protein